MALQDPMQNLTGPDRDDLGDFMPPSPRDLRALKDALGFTGRQMADLFGLAGDHQWRKYTGGQAPREMSLQMIFFAAARVELDEEDFERVLRRVRSWGASFDVSAQCISAELSGPAAVPVDRDE